MALHQNSSVCPSCARAHGSPADLVADPSLAAELCPQARSDALSALTATAAMLAALRPEPVAVSRPGKAEAGDFTLDADEVARRLGKSRRWVFRHAGLPFIR